MSKNTESHADTSPVTSSVQEVEMPRDGGTGGNGTAGLVGDPGSVKGNGTHGLMPDGGGDPGSVKGNGTAG